MSTRSLRSGQHSRSGLLAFAGLHEHWSPEHGEAIDSCAVITKEASGDLARIHVRMPVVLPRDAWSTWLDLGLDLGDLKSLLRPALDGSLAARIVSSRVYGPKHVDPECIAPDDSKSRAIAASVLCPCAVVETRASVRSRGARIGRTTSSASPQRGNIASCSTALASPFFACHLRELRAHCVPTPRQAPLVTSHRIASDHMIGCGPWRTDSPRLPSGSSATGDAILGPPRVPHHSRRSPRIRAVG